MMNTEHTEPTRWSTRIKLALAAVALVGVGAAGAFAVGATRPSVEMAPANPVAIRTLTDSDNVVTIRGQVAEVYGNKFVLTDASGKTLVETGRARDFSGLITPTALVATGQQVTVQGRFNHGSMRASFLIGADGKIVSLRPMGGRHGDRRDRRREDGGTQRANAPSPPAVPLEAPAVPPIATEQ